MVALEGPREPQMAEEAVVVALGAVMVGQMHQDSAVLELFMALAAAAALLVDLTFHFQVAMVGTAQMVISHSSTRQSLNLLAMAHRHLTIQLQLARARARPRTRTRACPSPCPCPCGFTDKLCNNSLICRRLFGLCK